ncbi:nuclear transport factor 2 family protein [Pseudonocardia adelaidensis]|uniref:SnoaL-like domain-containing protein n=1 Tax=Pseudonocardia adelaidensis TaxID=648754 RepID=A0ABP9P288_9PSEU
MPASDDPAAVLTRLLQAVDDLDWPAVRDCLADEVRTDYTELFGGAAETVSGDELVRRWQGLLPGFDATQHLIGTGRLEEGVGAGGDGPTVRTHVRGYHHIAGADGGATWGVHGHYVVPLVRSPGGWRIAGITLRVFYQEGNTGLPALATERAAISPRAARAGR